MLIGCALGGALGTKLTVVPFAVGVAGAVICSAGRRRALRTAALLLLPVALVLAPFAIRNAIDTGDPFFPLGRGLLGLPIQAPARKSEADDSVHPASTGFLGMTWGATRGAQAATRSRAGTTCSRCLRSSWPFATAAASLRDPVAFTLVLGFGFRPPTRLLYADVSLPCGAGGDRSPASGRGPRPGRPATLLPAFTTGVSFAITYQTVRLSFRSVDREEFFRR